ncbi:hypothetical protein GBAR_LOCUS14701, partial [Geodia barretti]
MLNQHSVKLYRKSMWFFQHKLTIDSVVPSVSCDPSVETEGVRATGAPPAEWCGRRAGEGRRQRWRDTRSNSTPLSTATVPCVVQGVEWSRGERADCRSTRRRTGSGESVQTTIPTRLEVNSIRSMSSIIWE